VTGRPARRWPRAARLLGAFAVWAALGVGAGLLLVGTAPTAFGYHPLIVMSGSMEPAIHTGDLVLVRPIPPRLARIGDVVTFHDPNHPSRLLTHRVRHIVKKGAVLEFSTKGDQNDTFEQWTVSSQGTISRVGFHIWKLGYIMFWLNAPYSRFFLIVIPSIILGMLELRRIWARNVSEARRAPA
jgi:signal peptidase I